MKPIDPWKHEKKIRIPLGQIRKCILYGCIACKTNDPIIYRDCESYEDNRKAYINKIRDDVEDVYSNLWMLDEEDEEDGRI